MTQSQSDHDGNTWQKDRKEIVRKVGMHGGILRDARGGGGALLLGDLHRDV